MFSIFSRLVRATTQRAERRQHDCVLRLECLESRDLLSAFTPTQIRHAYGIDQIPIEGNGTGQTIAIVDAYDHPNVLSDLTKFNTTYGIPFVNGAGLIKVNQAGTSSPLPAYNSGWAQEIALDVEWAHAIAPGANILLVEANSNSFSDLFAAVNTAKSCPGVVAVSMSWGSNEFSGESAYDINFAPSSNHPVAFIASSGDNGAVTSYPAVSPNVVSVGGTTLTADSSGNYTTEKGWNGSGGGISKYEAKPGYQSIVTQSSNNRTSPDVAYDADPNSGVYVIFNGSTYIFGGTSASAPQWAGLVAIADDLRNDAGLADLDGTTQVLPTIYSSATSPHFHDVTAGSTRNGRTTYSAGPGYDLVTGRGTPVANLLVSDLVTSVTTSSLSLSGSGGGSGTGSAGKHLGDDCDVASDTGSLLASPTAIVMELFDTPDEFVEPSLAPSDHASSDILFGSFDLDFSGSLGGLAVGQESQRSPLLFASTKAPTESSSAIATLSVSVKKGALGWIVDDEDAALSRQDSSSDERLVDLVLTASAEWDS